MKIDSVVVYRSFINAVRKIRDPSERCKAYDAMFDYGLDHIETELDDGAGIALELIKPLLDAQFQKKMTNRENGKKGGRPSGEAVISGEEPDVKTENNPKETENNPTITEKKRKKANHNPNDNVNDNANVNGNIKESTKEKLRFSKPAPSEIADYCRLRKNNVDYQRFFNYYESNGWMVGKTHMKDWKAAVRTWERNGYSGQEEKPPVYSTAGNMVMSMDEERELMALMGKQYGS